MMPVAYLGTGRIFGELALAKDHEKPRAASVICKT